MNQPTYGIDGDVFASFDELPDVAAKQVKLDITRQQVAHSEGRKEGERVSGLDGAVRIGREIFSLNIHTEPETMTSSGHMTYIDTYIQATPT